MKIVKGKYFARTIYWRNPEKNYAFEAIGKIELTGTIVYKQGIMLT